MTSVLAIGKVCAMTKANADLVNSAQAAQILHIDRSAFTRWVQMGRVPVHYRAPGKTGAYLFRRKDIEALAGKR